MLLPPLTGGLPTCRSSQHRHPVPPLPHAGPANTDIQYLLSLMRQLLCTHPPTSSDAATSTLRVPEHTAPSTPPLDTATAAATATSTAPDGAPAHTAPSTHTPATATTATTATSCWAQWSPCLLLDPGPWQALQQARLRSWAHSLQQPQQPCTPAAAALGGIDGVDGDGCGAQGTKGGAQDLVPESGDDAVRGLALCQALMGMSLMVGRG